MLGGIRGLGDLVAKATSIIGIQPKPGCGCKRRQQLLNDLIPFRRESSQPHIWVPKKIELLPSSVSYFGAFAHQGSLIRPRGNTIPAASCSTTDVQAAINSAGNGDTVVVPAGSCTWAVPVTFCKSITLQGAGAGNTNITVSIGTAFGDNAINVSHCLNQSLIRITGFTWLNTASGTDPFGIMFFNFCNGTTIRIDHNTFTANGNISRAMAIIGAYGVVDHNNITDLGIDVEDSFAADTLGGDKAWNGQMALGGTNAIYIEDNVMTYSTNAVDLDCQNGGKVVYRFNTISGDGIGLHGYDSVPRGCLEMDAYNNTIAAGSTGFIGVQYRGGTGVVYNNVVSGSWSGGAFTITNYRSQTGGFWTAGRAVCDGNYTGDPLEASVIDGNTAPIGTNAGWPCVDQIGRGIKQQSYPLYGWNNCTNALGCTPGGANQASITSVAEWPGTNFQPDHIQANRDYFDMVASYTGATGTGFGLLSGRPATCTQGVGYFATDQGILYQCGSANNWITYYTQLVHPHPLVT